MNVEHVPKRFNFSFAPRLRREGTFFRSGAGLLIVRYSNNKTKSFQLATRTAKITQDVADAQRKWTMKHGVQV